MSDPGLQQEAERAWHGKACVYIYAERGDSLETAFIGGYLAAAESRDQLIKDAEKAMKAFDEATSLLWLLSENDPNANMAVRREVAKDFLAEHRPVNPNVTSNG